MDNYDSEIAFRNGMVIIRLGNPLGSTHGVVRICGTSGEGLYSHWKGSIAFRGTEATCLQWIKDQCKE